MDKKASIIMPIYNSEQTLGASIESFLGQTISSECELICVDDGSTDASRAIVETYTDQHSNCMRLISGDHHGAGPARNKGIDASTGMFIGFLDSDDLYPAPDVLERMHTSALVHNALIVGGSLERFSESPEGAIDVLPRIEEYAFRSEGMMDYEDLQQDYHYQRFLFSRSLLDAHGIRFPPYLRYQDPPFFVAAMAQAASFYAIPEPTYLYRYRDTSKDIIWTKEKINGLVNGIVDVYLLASHYGYGSLRDTNSERLAFYIRTIIIPEALKSADSEILQMSANALLRLDPDDQQESIALHSALNSLTGGLFDIALQSRNELNAVHSSLTWKAGRKIANLIPRPRKR